MSGSPTPLLVEAAHAILDPTDTAGTRGNTAILIEGGSITEIGEPGDLRARHPQATVVGNGRQLLMPGLIDAHSHGRGLSPIQKGVLYDFLENNLLDWAVMPVLPPYLSSALAAIKHLRSGATTIHHIGFHDDQPNALDNAWQTIRGYDDTGIRLAISPGVIDRNRFAPDEHRFVDSLPPDLQALARPFVAYDPARVVETFFELYESLRAKAAGTRHRVLLAPSWAHGATPAFLQRVKEVSRCHGDVPIHIHTLQTPHQRAFGEALTGRSLAAFLDDLGLMDPALVLGHMVFASTADIELLAARGASVTHHPSCNLNMRNGIGPVAAMVAAGVNVCLGLDDKGINDDEDAVMELRMIHKLHRIPSYALDRPPPLDACAVLAMGTVNAARACGLQGQVGAIRPGMRADLILVDLDEILGDPWCSEALPIAELFVHRAVGRHVNTAIVDGRVVMQDRRFTTIDTDALYQEIRAFCRRPIGDAQRRRAEALQTLKPHLQAWYRQWERVPADPYYRLNDR